MSRSSFLHPDEVRGVYRRRAKRYDFTANLYYLIGFRERRYRRAAVAALALQPGDTVVELGCGTGLNFALLEQAIGPTGRIVGVDLTPEMLDVAGDRITRVGWRNVSLVESSAAAFQIPHGVDGILSTFALTLEPDYEAVIQRSAVALHPGKRLVLLDLRLPSTWLRHFAPLLVFMVKPFAVSLEVAKRRPWEAVRRYLSNYSYRPLYLGFAYIAIGEAPMSEARIVTETMEIET